MVKVKGQDKDRKQSLACRTQLSAHQVVGNIQKALFIYMNKK